jgi:hypothetical protein
MEQITELPKIYPKIKRKQMIFKEESDFSILKPWDVQDELMD